MSGRDPTNTVGRPYDGELRESVWSSPVVLENNAQTAVATLRSAWVYVGFIVDPGTASDVGLTAWLNILEPMLQGRTVPVAITFGAPPQAVIGLTVGARCELVVRNETGTRVTKLKAALWGMSRPGIPASE